MANIKISDLPAASTAAGTDVVPLIQGGVAKKLPLSLIPIPAATQAALDVKAPLASPTLTGTPLAPTASAGTNTTQIASTAFVKAAIDALIAGAPGALDTLAEIAAQLGADETAATALTALVDARAITGTNVITAAATLAGSKRNTVDGSTATYTVTLPAPTKIGQLILVERVDTSTVNAITVAAATGATLRGNASAMIVLPAVGVANEGLFFVAESLTSWTVMAGHKPKAWLDAAYATKATGTPGAGKYVDGGTNAWTTLPSVLPLNDRGDWAAGTTYAVNDSVKVSGVRYVTKVAHTASSAFTTDAASKWVQTGIDSSGAAVIGTTVTDIAPIGTRAVGTVGKAADAGHVHPLPNAVNGDITVYTADGTPVILRVVSGVVGGGSSGTAPSQVGTVTATPGSSSMGLSWSAPTAGSSAITDYVIQYKLTSSSTWNTFNDGVSTATTATVTGLTSGTSYDFRVAAVSSVGTGPYSATVTATPAGASLFSDNFTRADGPIGNGWTTSSPGLAISSNRLVSAGGNYSKQNAIRDLGVADGRFKITILNATAGSGPFLIFRYSDATNYWQVTSDRKLQKIVNGTSSEPLGHAFYNSQQTANFDIDVVLNGSSINVYYAGSDALGTTITDTFNQTATKFGVALEYPVSGESVTLFQQVS